MLRELQRRERPGTVTYREIDARLRELVREPMAIADVARMLDVHHRTVNRHAAAPGSGLHVYDGRVYPGTAREWAHYA